MADSPEQRLKHLICLTMHRNRRWTIARLAAKAGRSERAIYNWIGLALKYAEAADPAYLERLADRYERAVSHRRPLLAG